MNPRVCLGCLLLLGSISHGLGKDKAVGSPFTNEGVFPRADLLYPDGQYLQWDLDRNPDKQKIVDTGIIPFSGQFPVHFALVTEKPEKQQVDVFVFENPEAARENFNRLKEFAKAGKGRELVTERSGTNWEWYLSKNASRPESPRLEVRGRIQNLVYSLLDASGAPNQEQLQSAEENFRKFLQKKPGGGQQPAEARHPPRSWTSTSGKSIEAALLRYHADTESIDLVRSDGKVYRNLSLKTFSQTDQDYVKRLESP